MNRLSLSPNKLLILPGIALLALYIIFFSVPFYLPRYCATPIMPGELPFFFRLPQYHGPPLSVFILVMSTIGFVYLVLTERSLNRVPSIRIVAFFTVLFSLSLSLGYPVMSNDIFKYAFNGRILAVYGANPFLVAPDAFPQDPYLPLVYWQSRLSAYGPPWRWIEASSALLAPSSCLATILTLKAWSIAFFLGDAALVYLILKRVHPEKAALGMMIFAWNPLVVIECAVNGHNDSVMIFFILLAVYLALARRFLWAIPALVLSTMVKPIALILLPIFGLYVLKKAGSNEQRIRVGLGITALSVILVVGMFLPFWAGVETLEGFARQGWINGSPAALLYRIASQLGMNPNHARNITQVLFLVLYGILYAGELIALLRGRRNSLVLSTFFVLFWYLVLASFWFLQWYLLWLIAIVALIPQRTNLVRLVTVFTILILIAYPFVEWVAVPLIFGPVVCLAYRYRHDFVQEAVS